MEFVKITKNGKTKQMSRHAWENYMPKDKDGWVIKPDEPKELKTEKPLEVITKTSDDNLDEVKPDEPKDDEANLFHSNQNKGKNKK